MVKRTDIRIRDPFVLVDKAEQAYYLYGTTDENVWGGPATGFNVYRSQDLEQWEGPFPAFRPQSDFWADRHFWAPEVYLHEGKYYMFASFKSEKKCRGTQILVADSPLGPFETLTNEPITPAEWECLDGTLHIDEDGRPWIVFCQEWIQVTDGRMYAQPLSADLREVVGEPVLLFSASEAPWAVPGGDSGQVYVTDGPYLFLNKEGELLMLWSSGAQHGYAIGIARSESRTVLGPWKQDASTLFPEDGGHGMLFQALTGELMLAMHAPNKQPNERPVFIEVEEYNCTLQRK